MKSQIRSGVLWSIIILIILMLIDYINLPYTLRIHMSNMNYSFWEIFLIIVLYIATYKTLDKRTCEKEQNKSELSLLLIKRCYEECLETVNYLNDETVRKYIVPKIDFDSTDHKIIDNLQKIPFENESIIIDLIKEGQVNKEKIEKFFEIKDKYRQYVNMRVACFDGPHIFEPLKSKLLEVIDEELKEYKG